jgi:Fe-S cluster biogenesis protein NfuA
VNDEEVRAHVARVESLLEGLDERATEAVAALVQLYGEALRRLVAHVRAVPAIGDEIVRDELVAHVLMLHGLYPGTVEERVARVLDELRPYLGSRGGDVALIGIVDGVARVRLAESFEPDAAAGLKRAVEDAVLDAVPELRAVEAENVISLLPGGVVV